MSASENNKRGRLNRWAGRLINRRLVLWLWSLAVIALLVAALGAIFWLTRMKATYEVETGGGREGETFIAEIPREPLQRIVAGDAVEIDIGGEKTVAGLVRSVGEAVGATIQLEIAVGAPLPPRVKITLRSRRLLAAFRREG